MRKASVESDKLVRATAKTVITSVLVFVIGLYAIAFFMNRSAAFPSINLSGVEAVYTITRADGTTETYDHNHFSAVTYGDTLTCEIAPLGDEGQIQYPTLVFSLYHCYVRVYCGDELIYEQTEPEDGKMIGHRYYIIPLPDGYEDETITIVAVDREHDSFSAIDDMRIIPADRSTYAFRSGQFATGILLISLLVASIFMELMSVITYLRERRNDGLFSISFLCSSISLWYMGFSGYMQPFVESTAFLAMAEYIGLYLSPMALSFFCLNHTESRKIRFVSAVLTGALFVFFLFVTVMTIFAAGVSYVDYIGALRVLFLITLIVFFIAEFRERKVTRDIGEKTLHYGMTICIGLGIVELVRFLIAQTANALPWLSNSIMPVCILVLVFTALMYYGLRVTENQYQRIEEDNLKKLAYVDQLTGAPNRAACYERMDKMRKNNVTDYVVVFIDINFLKKTNDTWGHEKGDELIRTSSDLLQKHFKGDDFFGRWGGDEFIAVHIGTLAETRDIMHAIKEDIQALNASGERDFMLSESWGFGESTKEHPIDPDEAIRRADEQMYTYKQRVHVARE